MSEQQGKYTTQNDVAEALAMLGKGYEPEVPEGFNAPNHTQSPNDFYDYYLRRIDTLAELKVVCAFIRFTFGYHRTGFRMGIKELAEYTGLSRKSATTGAQAAEARKLLRRTNPSSKKKAEWELYVTRKVYASNAYILRETRVKSTPQVGLKERKKETKESPATENIFSLYENNIAMLTPVSADVLKEAEKTYPFEWIKDVIQIAVENNKRNWRYCEAILKRWQRDGKDNGKKPEQTHKQQFEDALRKAGYEV